VVVLQISHYLRLEKNKFRNKNLDKKLFALLGALMDKL
jgi:hypothetical protein